jgi:hypothetical protein
MRRTQYEVLAMYSSPLSCYLVPDMPVLSIVLLSRLLMLVLVLILIVPVPKFCISLFVSFSSTCVLKILFLPPSLVRKSKAKPVRPRYDGIQGEAEI